MRDAWVYQGATSKDVQTYYRYENTAHGEMNRLAAVWFDKNGDGDTADSGGYGMDDYTFRVEYKFGRKIATYVARTRDRDRRRSCCVS